MFAQSLSLKSLFFSHFPPFLRKYADRIEASPLANRLARGVLWALAGAVISRALGLLASILVARMLNKTGFGELGIIQSTIGMFGVFAGFGLWMTAAKHVAEFRLKDPAKAGRIMALSSLVAIGSGGLMAMILVLLAPWLATHTLAAPNLSSLLQIGAILLFLSALTGIQTGALAGFEAFKTIARVNLLAGLANFPLLVGGAYLAGLTGAVWGLTASTGVNWLLNHLALRAEANKANVPLTYYGCMKEWKVIWSFSFPALLSGAMLGPVTWICSAMLVNQPNGYAEMGIFNAANQWYGALLFLPGVLGQAVLPILSELLGQEDRDRSGNILILSIKLNALVVFPLVIIGCFVSPFIMQLYGEGFKEAWPTLIVVLFTAGLFAIETPLGLFLVASGKLWTGYLINTGWGIAFIIFTIASIGRGAMGLAAARLGAYALHGIWSFIIIAIILKKLNQSSLTKRLELQ
jgi:O-antigen/teichoic acid export membrane protein